MAGAAVLLMASPAMAWTNTNHGHNNQIVDGGPGAQANSSAKAKASSHSSSHATGGNANATGGAASVTNNVAMGSGNGSGSVGSAPTIFVPEGAGQAPCGGGIGLGGVGLTGGGSGGGSLFEFGDCKRMREAKFLNDLGVQVGSRDLIQASLNEMCQIGRVLEAFGGKCPHIYAEKTVVVTRKYPFDYCETRDAGDVNQHLECDRVRKVH